MNIMEQLLQRINEIYAISDKKHDKMLYISVNPLLQEALDRGIRIKFANMSALGDINFERRTAVYAHPELINKNNDPVPNIVKIVKSSRESRANIVICPISDRYKSAVSGLGYNVSKDLNFNVMAEDIDFLGRRYLFCYIVP